MKSEITTAKQCNSGFEPIFQAFNQPYCPVSKTWISNIKGTD